MSSEKWMWTTGKRKMDVTRRKNHRVPFNPTEGNEPWHGSCNHKERKKPREDKKGGQIKVRFGRISRK